MKQLIKTTNSILHLDNFEPYLKEYNEEIIKPIGFLDDRHGEKEKSFLLQSEYGVGWVNHLSSRYFERGNSYCRRISIFNVKTYIEDKMDLGLEVFVFENSKELLKWLAAD